LKGVIEMGLFTRLKQVIEADLHDLIDQKEQKNPMAMLNHYLRQCEQEVEKVKKLVERHYTLKNQYEREWHEAKKMAEKRNHQAAVAQEAGADDLYQFASTEQHQYEERAQRLAQLKEQAEKELEQLEQKYEQMKHKLKDMHVKKLELMGRENTARAHYRMNKVLDGEKYSEKANSRFEEMERYLDELERKVMTRYYESTIDTKIAQLEKELKNRETVSNE
jgi:lia operon protein LiaH